MRWSTSKLEPTPAGARRVRLVVVEEGGEGVEAYLSGELSADTVVIRQSAEELQAEYVLRTIQRIARIERSGQGIATAVILVGSRPDPQAMAARELLAHALLVHARVVSIDSSELTLAAGGQADAAFRHQLMALVEALAAEPEARSTTIRLRFGTRAPVEPAPVRSAHGISSSSG